MPISYKLSALSRILILLTFCTLSTQMLYVGDFCDFAGYDGTCLEASKCADLQPIMQVLGFNKYQVGRCGFEIREEIICCPKWPTPVQTPPKLPNEFIDLSKHPEFGYTPPPESVLNPGSIPTTTSAPIILNQNSNNNRESVQSEDVRIKAIFNGNPRQGGTGNNVGEWIGNSVPAVNGNKNDIFNADSLPNVLDNQKLNGNPVYDENELLKYIFGESLQFGNGNSKDERNGDPVAAVSGNNIGINANPVPNVHNNKKAHGNTDYDENERLRDIFGDNSVRLENDNRENENKGNSALVVNGNNNGIFNTNPVVNDNRNLNGDPVLDENGSVNNIGEWKGNSVPFGNGNNNGFFNVNPKSNINDNQNLKNHPVSVENELLKYIFGENPQVGNGKSEDERNGNPIPAIPGKNNMINANQAPNINNNEKPNDNTDYDENERLKDIFGDNSQQLQNGNSENERGGNPVPTVSVNNNMIFNTNPVAKANENRKLNDNPVFVENERFNAIFSGNPGRQENENIKGIFNASPELNINNNKNSNFNPVYDERLESIFGDNPVQIGNGNSQEERKGNPVPVANENNNDFINRNPVAKANDNTVFDENERLNAIFRGNPVQIGMNNSQEERKGGLPFVPVANGNFNEFFNTNPLVNDNRNLNGNPILDDNERFNAIFSFNPGQAGSVNNIGEWNSVPVENGNNNGFFNANPVANMNDNQKSNGNTDYDEDERLKDIFGDNPLQLDNGNSSGSNKEISNSNAMPKENILGRKGMTIEGENIYDNAAMASKTIQDENALIKAILNGNLNRIGSPMMGAEENAGENGQISRNPNRNYDERINPSFNTNPNSFHNTFPSRYDNPVAFGNINMNGILNRKPLLAEHRNEGTQNVFLESRNALNNGHWQHVRSEEALHHRRQQVHRGFNRNKPRPQSRQNQRVRFYE